MEVTIGASAKAPVPPKVIADAAIIRRNAERRLMKDATDFDLFVQ
jgi:hypothetical protein